jgi:hypothetical protein
MMFTYWCVNDNGIKSSFRSEAIIDIGVKTPDGVIVDVYAEAPWCDPADFAYDFEIGMMMEGGI